MEKLVFLVILQDYPQAKPRLLELLAICRAAVALPGEKVGVTHTGKHSIVLKVGAQPSYVPSYRLPYSQRAVVERLVQYYHKEGGIQ